MGYLATLAREASGQLARAVGLTDDERLVAERVMQGLAERAALQTAGGSPLAALGLVALADARCSSQAAEDEAGRFNETKRAESQAHLAQMPPGAMARGRR